MCVDYIQVYMEYVQVCTENTGGNARHRCTHRWTLNSDAMISLTAILAVLVISNNRHATCEVRGANTKDNSGGINTKDNVVGVNNKDN